jgi:hypothetical protein
MRPERLGLGTFAFLLAGLVAVSPLILGRSSLQLVGTLLIVTGALEGLHSFLRVTRQAAARRILPRRRRLAHRRPVAASGALTIGATEAAADERRTARTDSRDRR